MKQRITEVKILNASVNLTGDQLGRMGKHNVLHTGRTFLLGLDLLRGSNHRECRISMLFAVSSCTQAVMNDNE